MKKLLSIILVAVFVSISLAISASAMHWKEGGYEIDEKGKYHPDHAWGYEFNIDSVDCMDGETAADFTNAEAHLNGAGYAKQRAHAVLDPADKEAYTYTGCGPLVIAAAENVPAEAPDVSEDETTYAASDVVTNESAADTSGKNGSTAFEKVFQVIMIVVMSIGVLGLPLYFWLNSRKKRLISEYNESKENDGSEGEEGNIEEQDK